MTEDGILFGKHLKDLYRKSEGGGYFVFTDFLGLGEQSVLKELFPHGHGYTLFGGTEGCERVMARFGDPDELGYEAPFPILTLLIEPRSQKFADKLTHRDVLGAVLNLGIERDVLGDIVLKDNVAFMFVKEDMADFICSSLSRVKHTDVNLKIADRLPEGELFKTERRRIQVSGERIDAVVAKVFNLSRDDSQALIKRGFVFADGKEVRSAAEAPRCGEKISVRGHGRFIYLGYESDTRKGKMNVAVEVFV